MALPQLTSVTKKGHVHLNKLYAIKPLFLCHNPFKLPPHQHLHMPYESTISFIKDTSQIIQQYYHIGKIVRSHFTQIDTKSRLDTILAHLSHSRLPEEYEQQPRPLKHILATELLGHSLAPTAFVTGLLYNPKNSYERT